MLPVRPGGFAFASGVSALCSLTVFSGQALAEIPNALLGTQQVTMQPYRADGELKGCQIVFSSAQRDWTYANGAVLKVDGSINLLAYPMQIGSTLKVVVNKIDDAGGTYAFTPMAPTRAYLTGPDHSTNLAALLKSAPSDTPGAVFAVFEPVETMKFVYEAFESGKLTIAFNIGEGGTDILTTLDVDVEDTAPDGKKVRSDKTFVSFQSCVETLMRKARDE